MPLYAIHCLTCGAESDTYRKVEARDQGLPGCCGAPMVRKITAPHAMPDLAAYQAVAVDRATGKAPVIEGRKAHREFLKRNGYREIGNDMPDMSKRTVQGDFNVREELRAATREVLSKPQHHSV